MTTWTRKMVRTLKKDYPTADLNELAEKLGKSVGSIRAKAQVLRVRRAGYKKHHKWKKKELKMIAELYPYKSTVEIAEMLGFTVSMIAGVAERYGMKKSHEFLVKQGKHCAAHPNTLSRRFKKGHPSHNAGRKRSEWMSAENIEKVKETQFKKGHVPWKTKPIGYKSKYSDGYWYIKTEDGMELLHTHVWNQHHGEVPDGHVLIFIDGNHDNCDISNLKMVSKSELMAGVQKRLTKEQRKQMAIKSQEARKERIRKDLLRIRWGLEPVSKLVKGYGGLNR